MSHVTAANTELFKANWTVYQRVVANNYMFHQELYTAVQRLLGELEVSPLNLLDLGCGDAEPFAPVLRGLSLSSYTGVDLSDVALPHAAGHLAALPCPIHLRQADMLEFLRSTTDSYEFIFSSFALHHLDTVDKQAFLTACHKHLAPAGSMILIDTARERHQDLAAWIDDYCQNVATNWMALNVEERGDIIDHVRGNDLPESIGDLATMAAQAGFSRFELLASHTAHHLFSLRA